jgi:hypothetical protein
MTQEERDRTWFITGKELAEATVVFQSCGNDDATHLVYYCWNEDCELERVALRAGQARRVIYRGGTLSCPACGGHLALDDWYCERLLLSDGTIR